MNRYGGITMKKNIMILLSFLMIFTFAGCSNNDIGVSNSEPDWKIIVEGVKDGEIEFTNIDLEKLEFVEIEAILRKKDGSEENQQWKGVPLKTVLEYLQVKEYEEIVVEAADGYSKGYTEELVNKEGTILGIEMNGKLLDEESGPVQLVPQGESGNMWIKNVAKIKVVQ